MASRTPLLLLLALTLTVLLFSATFADASDLQKNPPAEDEEEDLSFLEEPKPPAHDYHAGSHDHGGHDDGDDSVDHGGHDDGDDSVDHGTDGGGEYEDFQNWNSQFSPPSVDEKDVVALNGSDFSDFIANNKYVLVEFYAPWCGHCQSLAPEYAAAATELKAEGAEVVLAKVDATVEDELSSKYNIEGFPTIYFFVDGEHKPYEGPRTKEAIVAWLKKKTGPAVNNVTTVEEAEKILSANSKIVVAFLDNLTGPESQDLKAAAQEDDEVDFYQTSSADVAKIFNLDATAKLPALVLLKKEAEKLSTFAGEFSKSAIVEFVSSNKFPLVFNFTRETGPIIFDLTIQKQVLLFAAANESGKLIPALEEASKAFKGKLVFVYVEMDNEDYGVPMSDYFGITGASPKILAYTGMQDGRKFLFDGDSITTEKIKSFATNFLEDKLKPFYKSEPIPEENNGNVKIVVGKNFDQIVLDESKDVLLEIYAPWCPHCHSLEKPYNRLAKHLSDINSLVIAKMDGTTNEHPKAKSEGFPTILFFPAGNSTADPIVFEGDRTAVEMYKFIKKHAGIPFKITNPIQAPKPTGSATNEGPSSDGGLRDEL